MRRLSLAVFALAIVAAACSSGDDKPDAGGASEPAGSATTVAGSEGSGTTLPGVTGTIPEGDLPGGTSVTTIEVTLPPVEPIARPEAVDENGEASVPRLEGCLSTGSCADVEAPLVAWPGADLAGVDLAGAVLTGVDFRGADLSGANLTGANLSGANLAGAKFDGAALTDSNLTGAALTGASFRGAGLAGANLFEALIDGASFRAAIFCRTVWVDGSRLNDMC